MLKGEREEEEEKEGRGRLSLPIEDEEENEDEDDWFTAPIRVQKQVFATHEPDLPELSWPSHPSPAFALWATAGGPPALSPLRGEGGDAP